ncbi:hypothetical protein HZS_5340 [Henneguya salminicola]|nr:hypothetical protein HZS_5340 [Henneguya salminicola]
MYHNTVDFTNRIPLKYYLIYDLNGAQGNHGRMIIYASVEIYQVNRNHHQRDFRIKVHSIYWKNYKLTNGQCCSINTFERCEISCAYFIQFFISEDNPEFYDSFPPPKLKENYVYVYIVTPNNAPTSKYNISIVLKELEDEHIIDIANINPEEYLSAEAFLVINLKVALLYDEDICHRNGICKIINKKINCKCNKEYKGKYCEKLICRNDCNGNGYCTIVFKPIIRLNATAI